MRERRGRRFVVDAAGGGTGRRRALVAFVFAPVFFSQVWALNGKEPPAASRGLRKGRKKKKNQIQVLPSLSLSLGMGKNSSTRHAPTPVAGLNGADSSEALRRVGSVQKARQRSPPL